MTIYKSTPITPATLFDVTFILNIVLYSGRNSFKKNTVKGEQIVYRVKRKIVMVNDSMELK